MNDNKDERPFGLFRQDPNTMVRIEHFWAFLSVDPEDGNEGIVSVKMGDAWMPLIAADEERVRVLKPIAEGMAVFGTTIKLVKFTTREEVETYGD